MLLRFATCLSEKSGCYILYNLILNAINFHQSRKGHRYTFFFFSLNLVLIGFPGPSSSRNIWSSFFLLKKSSDWVRSWPHCVEIWANSVWAIWTLVAPECLRHFFADTSLKCHSHYNAVTSLLASRTDKQLIGKTFLLSWFFFSVFGISRRAEYNSLWSQLIVNPVWSQSDRSGKFSPELDPIIEMSQKDRFQRGHRFIFFVLIFVLCCSMLMYEAWHYI